MYLFPETPSMQQFMAWYNFLGQKMCSVARGQTDTQTHMKVNTEDTMDKFTILLKTINLTGIKNTSAGKN